MEVTMSQLVGGLYAAVAVVLLVVLYNLLIILVDVRKITGRVESVTEQVEDIIMKPLSMADAILAWVMEQVEATKEAKKPSKKKVRKKG